MKKLESSLKNMLLSLALIAAVCGLALGFVYGITKDKIAQAAQEKKEAALNAVLPAYETLREGTVTIEGEDRALDYYTAYNAREELVGVAVSTYTKNGFNGEFALMVGLKPDGGINNISVLRQGETPGLGAKMLDADCKLPLSFLGKTFPEGGFKVVKDGGEIDAITAATISSRAYCDAVNRACLAFEGIMADFTIDDEAGYTDAASGATPAEEAANEVVENN